MSTLPVVLQVLAVDEGDPGALFLDQPDGAALGHAQGPRHVVGRDHQVLLLDACQNKVIFNELMYDNKHKVPMGLSLSSLFLIISTWA